MATSQPAANQLPGDRRHAPDAVVDGGDLDCGSGLLLMIRNAISPLNSGGILEIRSRESSVREDLPAWCRMVGHSLLETSPGAAKSTSYFVRKKADEQDDALSGDLDKAKNYIWKVRVKWVEGMKARVFARNHSWDTGQPASFNTEDAAPAAVEYLVGALAGCLAVGFQWRLAKRGVTVNNLEVQLQARIENVLVFLGLEDSGSPALKSIVGKVYLDAAGADDAVLSDVWQDTVKRSPVAQTLLRGVPVTVDFARVT